MRKLTSVPLDDIAKRVRLAREQAKKTQAQVADHLGVARTTLVAIEKGQRRIKLTELQRLVRYCGTTVNELFRTESIPVDFAPKFRKLSNSCDQDINEAIRLLIQLAKAEVELENALGIQRSFTVPLKKTILPGYVEKQAEEDALEIRQRLGLGNSSISDIFSLLEFEFGMRIYTRKLNSTISGLFAYDRALGPCMLLNSIHPRERRVQTAAHELGHFLTNSNTPDVLTTNIRSHTIEERYAKKFGYVLLVPARPVIQKFHEITAGSSTLTRRHVIILAHYFGVSREALVKRLEDLTLVKKDTWDWFVDNGGITNEQVLQVLGERMSSDPYTLDQNFPVPERLLLLAVHAFRQNIYSQGQLKELLGISLTQLRRFMFELDDSEIDVDGKVRIRK